MNKKYEVHFFYQTDLDPSVVYVSPSPAYQGYFAVSILYVSKKGDSQLTSCIGKTFSLEQNLFKQEEDALKWAKQWLSDKSGSSVTLSEISD